MAEPLRAAPCLAAVLYLALGAGLAAATGTVTSATVRPSRVHPRTTVTVSFRAPAATGSSGSLQRRDVVSVSGAHRSGCTWSRAAAAGTVAANALARVKLAPAAGRGWCRGRFNGQVTEYQSTVCGPPQSMIVCPLVEIAPQTIARFSFRVR